MQPHRNEDGIEIGDAIPKLTLRQLTYFLAAANQQSVLRAAETLNVSSPSISAAITQIEEFLQVQLFTRRHARGLILTPAGRDLAASARSILLQAREIEKLAGHETSPAAGRLSIGCLTTLAPYLLPLILKEASIANPFLQLRWREDTHDNLLEALHNGAIDLIIVYDYDIPTTLQVTSLRPMPVQVVLPAHHALARQSSCSLAQVAEEPLVLLDHPKTRDYFLSLFSAKGLAPHVAHRSSSYELTRSLVANGFGYTLLNFSPPYSFLGQRNIVSRPLDDVDKPQNLVLARLYRFRAPKALDEINACIAAALKQLPISS